MSSRKIHQINSINFRVEGKMALKVGKREKFEEICEILVKSTAEAKFSAFPQSTQLGIESSNDDVIISLIFNNPISVP